MNVIVLTIEQGKLVRASLRDCVAAAVETFSEMTQNQYDHIALKARLVKLVDIIDICGSVERQLEAAVEREAGMKELGS